MRKAWSILVAALALVQLATSEVIVGHNVRLALMTRAEAESNLRWCYVFFQDDFPEDSICETFDDGYWDHFPECCNAAYQCKDGSIWKTHLCYPGSIYDDNERDCVEYKGDVCPYREGNTPEEPSEPVLPDVPIDCGSLVNGKLPHPTDCASWIDCTNGEATVHKCYPDYIYYHKFKACVTGDVDTCLLHSVKD